MVTVSQIAVNLSAQTAQFEAGLNKAKSLLGSFADKLGGISGIAKIGTIAGLGAAVADLALQFKSLISTQNEAMDKSMLLSKTFGTTADVMERFRFVAEMSDVTLDDLLGNLQKLQRNVGSFGTDAAPASKALEALGLSARVIVDLPIDRKFGVIVEGLRGISNQSERAALAQEMFGKSSVKILRMIDDGADGFEKTANAAKEYGFELSHLDTSRLERLNDLGDKNRMLWAGFGARAAREWNIFKEGVMNAENALLRFFFVKEFWKGPNEPLPATKAIEDLAKATNAANWDAFIVKQRAIFDEDPLQKYKNAIAEINQHIQQARDKGVLSGEMLEAADRAQKKSQQAFEGTQPLIAENKALEEKIRLLQFSKEWLDKYNRDNVQGMKADVERNHVLRDRLQLEEKLAAESKKNQQWQMKLGNDAKKVWQDTLNPLEEFRNKVEELQDLFAEGFLDQETFERGILKAKQAFDESQKLGERGVGSATKGSQDAFSAISQFNRANLGQGTLKEQLEVAKRQEIIQAKMAKDIAAELNAVIGVQGI